MCSNYALDPKSNTYSCQGEWFYLAIYRCALNEAWHKGKRACVPVVNLPVDSPHQCFAVGNPINPLTGVKSQVQSLGLSVAGEILSLNYSNRVRVKEEFGSQGISETFPVTRFAPAGFGALWGLSHMRSIEVQRYGSNNSKSVAYLRRGDGEQQLFASEDNVGYKASAGQRDRLISLATGGYGGWRYYDDRSLSLEIYDNVEGLGRDIKSIIRRQSARGGWVAMEYSSKTTPATVAPVPGLLIRLVDHNGRSVGIEYVRNELGIRVSKIYAGSESVLVDYDAAGNLSNILWPDGTFRNFVYEHAELPWALTGIFDENGRRHSVYEYDANGSAVGTGLAGGAARYLASYVSSPQRVAHDSYDGNLGVYLRRSGWQLPDGLKIISPSDTEIQIKAIERNGAVLLSSSSQPAGSGCAAAVSKQEFDSNGNLLVRDDFNGQRVCLSQDIVRNLELSRVEGMSSAASCSGVLADGVSLPAGVRKVSTQWHPDWRLVTRVAEPKRVATMVYNGQPDPFTGQTASCAPSSALLPDGKPIVVLCKQVEQATVDASGTQGFGAALQSGVPLRTWQYTYNEFGQVLTAKDPLNNTTRYTYFSDTTAEYTKGDLQSVTNPLGQVTRYPRYNPHGQVLEKVDANQVVTTYGYDLRQRLTSISTAGATTSYAYWPTGLLRQVTQADKSFVAYEYDDAHRLVAVTDNLGNRIDYTLDNAGNKTSEQVKDPSGQLARQLTRVMDALGRVQQETGRE